MSVFRELAMLAMLGLGLGCAPDIDSQKFPQQTKQSEALEEPETLRDLYDFDLRYPGEREVIECTAKRVCRAAGIKDFEDMLSRLMMAIRSAENGSPGREFGIMPTERYKRDRMVSTGVDKPRKYRSTLEKQASWCAWTIVKRRKEWIVMGPEERSRYRDFIDYLGDSYCPVGASNDPTGLNRNWERNVRKLSKKYGLSF